jgi:hypothetical protein
VVTDRQTHRHTNRQNDYRNLAAHAPTVNYEDSVRNLPGRSFVSNCDTDTLTVAPPPPSLNPISAPPMVLFREGMVIVPVIIHVHVPVYKVLASGDH